VTFIILEYSPVFYLQLFDKHLLLHNIDIFFFILYPDNVYIIRLSFLLHNRAAKWENRTYRKSSPTLTKIHINYRVNHHVFPI